jgi:hypothetical protein
LRNYFGVAICPSEYDRGRFVLHGKFPSQRSGERRTSTRLYNEFQTLKGKTHRCSQLVIIYSDGAGKMSLRNCEGNIPRRRRHERIGNRRRSSGGFAALTRC